MQHLGLRIYGVPIPAKLHRGPREDDKSGPVLAKVTFSVRLCKHGFLVVELTR